MNEVDKPGSDVEVYVKGLDKVLLKKIKIITDLREKLLNFYSHLKTEEHMSRLYERNLDAANMDETEETQVSSLNAFFSSEFWAATRDKTGKTAVLPVFFDVE